MVISVHAVKCVYCRGARVLESFVAGGDVACRVCLGTGVMPEEPYSLGHDLEPRVLRRIAELVKTETAARAVLDFEYPKRSQELGHVSPKGVKLWRDLREALG